MTELGRPVQRKHQLSVYGLLGPQGAVVVEYRDAVALGDEIRRIRISHRGDELRDRLLRGRLTPARQLIGAHCRLLRLMLTVALMDSSRAA